MRPVALCVSATLSLLFCVLFVSAGHAQTGARTIHILTAGALLGQLDGMPEYPGGSFDVAVGPGIRPYGGLMGLIDWLRNRPTQARPDLFLLTGNNQPQAFGRYLSAADQGASQYPAVEELWIRVKRDLAPNAIGFGTEDFLRALTDGGNAGRLAAWVRKSNEFVASNVAVRLHAPHLNVISSKGFTLRLDETASVGWVADLNMTYPCEKVGLRAVLVSGGKSRESRVAVQPRIGSDVCRARIALSAPLQPGEPYGLEIRVLDKVEASFTFRTDETFTKSAAIVPLPDSPLPIVFSMIEPRVRSMLSDAKWRWSQHDNRGACAAESCEIIVLPPIEAYDQVLSLIEAERTTRPVALISALEDSDTFAMLQHSSRIRFVVFPPDTAALGRAAERSDRASVAGGVDRAARAGSSPAGARTGSVAPARDGSTVPPPFSGDLGYGAVLNANFPAATQVWSRPEWLGETIHEMSVQVTPDAWEFREASHTSASVPGRALCAKSSGTSVEYYLATVEYVNGVAKYSVDYSSRLGLPADRYPEVAPDLPYDKDRRIAQGALWSDLDSFAAMTLDAMRRGLNSELALLPASAVDENQLVYLRDDAHAPRQALSRVILDRVLFRAGAVVRVTVAAGSLIETVNKILAAGKAENESYCLSGFGTTGCGTARLDRNNALFNGRDLNKDRFYTIAMPESVALQSGLSSKNGGEHDLIDLVDAGFARSGAGDVVTCAADYGSAPAALASNPETSLPTRLERAYADRATTYLLIKPADVSFSETQVGEPPDGQGLFSKLPIPNSGAKPSRRFSTNVGVDAGLFDTRRVALRAVGSLAYGHANVNGSTSTDPNNVTVGLRADWKLNWGARLFAGPFVETQFGSLTTQVQATRKIPGLSDPAQPGTKLPTVTVAGPTLSLVTPRRQYDYVGAGFELVKPQVTSRLSVDPLRLTFALGQSEREHVDVTINGESQGLAAFQQLGAAGLLSRYYASHVGTLTSDTPYAFIDEALHRYRVQADITPDFKWAPAGGRAIDVSLATTYRQYVGPNMIPLAERRSMNMKLTIAVPLYRLATINLTASEYLVQVNGMSGWFTVWTPGVSVGIPVIIARHGGRAF